MPVSVYGPDPAGKVTKSPNFIVKSFQLITFRRFLKAMDVFPS